MGTTNCTICRMTSATLDILFRRALLMTALCFKQIYNGIKAHIFPLCVQPASYLKYMAVKVSQK